MTFIQARPMEQAPQGMGTMPPAPTAGYTQQRVQAPAAATPYGATAGYPQQQPQQQYQQQAQGYGECLHVSSIFNGVVVNRSKYFLWFEEAHKKKRGQKSGPLLFFCFFVFSLAIIVIKTLVIVFWGVGGIYSVHVGACIFMHVCVCT